MTDLHPHATPPGDEPDGWTPISLNTLPDTPPVQPDLGGTHLIYPGKRHVFSGLPESAKTLAAYCVLIQVTRHGDTAILIDFEMGAYDARQRLRELGATPPEIDRIRYLEPEQAATISRITSLLTYQPTLVVIDAAAGAYDLQGLDDNKRKDVEHLSKLYVGIFRRNGIATILIDHVVKDSEARGKFTIGSERKLGGADVHLGFDTITPISRGTAGRYKITTHKDRGGYLKRGHLADLHLDSDPDTHEIDWTFTEPQLETTETGAFRPTGLMEKVSTHLQLQSEPRTRNEICDTIGGRKKYVLAAVAALVGEGFATETAGPNRSKLIRHARPYREADDAPAPNNDDPTQVVPVLFRSSSRNHSQSGGSVVPPYVVGEPPDTSAPDHPKTHEWFHHENGWLNGDGNLQDIGPDLEYLASLAPDDDEPVTPTSGDIDWSTP